MLGELCKFTSKLPLNEKYNIYIIAMDFHNNNNIIGFKDVILKERIISKFKQEPNFYVSEELVHYLWYDLSYYYTYGNQEELNEYFRLIINTVDKFNKNDKEIV